MDDYTTRDRAVWQDIFATMPPEWFDAPPSDAIIRCGAYFEAHPCRRLLDLGCGFGRWARFLAGHGADEVVGVDYAELGISAAAAWARREGFNARFLVASATALPFHGRPFDGVLAALVLDGLSRDDGRRAVRSFTAVARPGARGFFVFNPRLTAAEWAAMPDDNPTKGCTHVEYEDEELAGVLPGWSIDRVAASLERFRLVEATLPA